MRILSLLSGTSADGIDVGLVRVEGEPGAFRLELERFQIVPYPEGVRERILDAWRADARAVARLDALLGELFSVAAAAMMETAAGDGLAIDAVASHGQTICHLPRGDASGPPATLQIGQPDRIAERTGLPVVCDFRQRDLAAGGQGAPLVPFLDQALFAREGEVVVAVNLGGIMNLTAVTGDPDRVVAFDVGPANGLLDELVRRATRGRESFDEDGATAARGIVRDDLVAVILDHPFLSLAPPRSTSREVLGEELAMALERRGGGAPLADLLASTVRAEALALARAISGHVTPRVGAPAEVVLSGGGGRNRALVQAFREALAPVSVVSSGARGCPPDAKEALLFALLAHETLHGRPSNVPAVTGAGRRVVLGKICPGAGRGILVAERQAPVAGGAPADQR